MKKFYLLTIGIILTLANTAFGQFVATNSGNWSSNATWAPGTKPTSPCNGCTITINANVVVTLDVSIRFTGGTVLTIGSDASSPSGLIITTSAGTSIPTGHNILLDIASVNNKIVLRNGFSALTSIPGGVYDGIFSDIANGAVDIKTVGNATLQSLFFAGQPLITPIVPPIHGSSLAGPGTLSSNGTLPVVLDHFNASFSNNQVLLDWATLVEINSDHFAIERSADGSNWQTLGTLAAAGNSETKVSYSFTDPSPSSGANYYRLQMVDRDGKYKYSPVKVVRGSLVKGFSIFPNPAREFLNVTVSADASAQLTFRIINPSGQVLLERAFTNAAGTTVSLPVQNFPAGNYILTIAGKDGSGNVNKFMIAR
jgi:Secretion system C-terminal sorting domain